METNTSRTDGAISEVELALCRATLYAALALGFRPPTDETIGRLCSKEGSAALADAATVIDPDGDLASAAGSLALSDRASVTELSALFLRLFGHTARSTIPPYETEYGAEALFQQPHELGDLMGFYKAFGLTLNTTEHERADHVSCECEFLAFLALKEAYALEHGDSPMLADTRKAARLFLRDHLGRFFPAFGKKLAREDRGGFYGSLADLCYRFVSRDCARFDVSVGPDNLSLRPATDDRVPMACGGGAECMALSGTGEVEATEEE